jgi:hypothetical protein
MGSFLEREATMKSRQVVIWSPHSTRDSLMLQEHIGKSPLILFQLWKEKKLKKKNYLPLSQLRSSYKPTNTERKKQN